MDKDALVTEDELPPVDDDLAGRADLRGVLLAAGLSAEAFDLAEGDGTLPLLAIEHLVLPEPATYDLSELSDVTGMPASQIAQLWRSLGFAEPQPGDRIFTSADAEMLHTVAGFLEMGAIDPGLVVQMSRVIGSSLARVASAQIDAIDAGSADEDALDADDGDAIDRDDAADSSSHTADETADQRRRAVDRFSLFAGSLLPTLPKVMDYVWRRHLQAAARQRINRGAAGVDRDRRVVGFADLVGFTVLSQQVSPRELAAVVDRFETIAYDTVAQLGGHVVKMIGDEVMFSVVDDQAAVEIGLTLARAYAHDDGLSDVRVGLAAGPVLQREADLFGPVVNLASRIVGLAFPTSVVVDESVHDVLADHPAFRWQSIGRRRLKDIGRVPLWVAHRAEIPVGPKSPRDRARGNQAERRERTIELLASAKARLLPGTSPES